MKTFGGGNYAVSRKIKDAIPIQMYGYVLGSKAGVALPKLVKDGLLLAGDSAGYQGIIHAIVSGRYAGAVAARAAQEGDVSEKRLREYEDASRKTGLHLVGASWEKMAKLYKMSDEAIEAVLPEMLAKNEVQFRDIFPF